ncbi:hypothetical protein Tco_1250063 [Tanacetum coccineum]
MKGSFHRKNVFGLWQVRMKALLEQQGLAATLEELPAATIVACDNVIQKKACSALILCLGDRVRVNLNILMSFTSCRDTLKLEDVLATLNSRKLQKLTEAKGDGGEGLYNHKKSQDFVRNKDQVSSFGADEYDNADVMMAMNYDGSNILLGDGRECRVRRTCKVQVKIRNGSNFVLDNVRYVSELRRNLISLGTLKKEGFTVKMQSGKIKVIKGSLIVLSGTRRANCVYTLDGQAVTRKTLKGRKQLGKYQTG